MAEYIKRADVMTICERYSQHCFETSDSRGQDIADRMLDDIAEMTTANVVEVKDCEKCEHFDKHSTQPICICCSNRYTNNFKPKRSDA